MRRCTASNKNQFLRGGEATAKPASKGILNRGVRGGVLSSWTLDKGDDAYLVISFSKAYPELTEGKCMFAEVSVDQAQLQHMIDSAFALVKWLARELMLKNEALRPNLKALSEESPSL
jgi:hypothetical protein